MWVIFVEAAAAMFVFVFIVWWTMFSGKGSESSAETPTEPLLPENQVDPSGTQGQIPR